MNHIIGLMFLLLMAGQPKQENTFLSEGLRSEQRDQPSNKKDNLFQLRIKANENLVHIIAPKSANFELPDSAARITSFTNGDFNADGKEDILVYLGACGTGGCMYALFLNQYDNYYKLAYFDYLKNAGFKIQNNGLWTIESSVELEPYNPSKIQITIYTLDKNRDQYTLDTTYVYYDPEVETMINEVK